MKRFVKVTAALGLVVATLSGVPALACATVGPPSAPAEIVEESTVIVWDAAHQTQHFIRHAAFNAKSADIGFLVPTPSLPQLATANDEAFTQLEDAVKPRTVYATTNHYRLGMWLGGGSAAEEAAGMANSAPAKGSADLGVEVLAQQRVGRFDATVLAATDSSALGRWLKAHHYATSPELMEWIKPYVEQGWKITAFKLAKQDKASPVLTTDAIRMSFTTARPFYPYREPAAPARGAKKAPGLINNNRLLRVYFISDQRMEGALATEPGQPAGQGSMEPIGGKVWPGQVKWAGPLASGYHAPLARLLDLKAEQFPATMHLTAFDDKSAERLDGKDVYFAAAADQSAVEPPPFVVKVDKDVIIPLDAIFGLVFVGLVVAPFVIHRRRRG